MGCKKCGKEILPGEHVFPYVKTVGHRDCGSDGIVEAVMGSDSKLRWCFGDYRVIEDQEEY